MKIPKGFELAGAKWKVVQIEDFALLGQCQRDVRTIHLRKNLGTELKEQTFIHELVHAIKYTLGEEDHNEQAVDAFAALLHQYLITLK